MNNRILETFTGCPLLMHAGRAARFVDALTKTDAARVLTAAASPAPSFDRRGSDAVIRVHGPLSHRASVFDALFGMTSYEAIEAQFDAAIGDPSVARIVLDVDSPGGEVSGAFDLADKIAASTKPTAAYVNGMAASAAYLLAASTNEIVATRSSQLGSIGVVSLHVSSYGANIGSGFEVREIASGKSKTDGSPYRPLDPAAEESIRADVEKYASMFFAHVAQHRGMDASAVESQEAAIYIGDAAVAQGLADRLGRYEAAAKGGYKVSGEQMTTEAAPIEPVEVEVETIETPETKPEEPQPEPEKEEEPAPDLFSEGVTAERNRTMEIGKLTLDGCTDLAMQALAEGWHVEQFLRAQTARMSEFIATTPRTLADAPVRNTPAVETKKIALTKESSDEDIDQAWKTTKVYRDEYTSFQAFRAMVRRGWL
jgi:signal peptide peptidase SppA